MSGSIFAVEPTFHESVNFYRYSLRHIESGGIGYNKGYTTLEGFFGVDPEKRDIFPFIDLRGHLFDDGYFAANLGVGLRWLMNNRVYGLNSYYDFRNDQYLSYNQLGFGFENLGTVWDFRANGYLPVAKKMAASSDAQFYQFTGNQMLLTQPFEFAMRGIDAEFGLPFLSYKGATLYAAAGPYYYIGKLGGSATGGRVRLKVSLGQYVAIDFSDSYDSRFKNNFQVQLSLMLPSTKKSSRAGQNQIVSRSRMVESVSRDEIIVAGTNDQITVAIDPATGQPYHFVFVDNTSHSAGTFESPYNTLAIAEANSKSSDIIYVFPGDGTTAGMDRGITLKPNQKLWGSGINQQLQTSLGSVSVPAQSSTGPQLTNSLGGYGILLSTNNQISGFTIRYGADHAIYGLNPQNVQIYSTEIISTLGDQVHLEYTEAGSADFNNVTFTNGLNIGIYINSTGPSFVGSINQCKFVGNAARFIDASFNGATTFSFTNNTVNDGYASYFNFAGPSSLVITNNTITNSSSISDQPIGIEASGSSFTATIENNTISNNVVGAISMTLENVNSADITIKNNTMNQNGTGTRGVLFGSTMLFNTNGTTSNNLNLTLGNNTASGNTGHVFGFGNGGFNQLNITASENLITNNSSGGFVFDVTATTLTLNANRNTISGGNDHAILTSGGTLINTLNMNLSNNQITNNVNQSSPGTGVNGISLNNDGNSINFTATNNNISGNSGTAIIFYSSTGMNNVTATINNNTISNNQNVAFDQGGGGIDLEQFSNLSAEITNNTLSNNQSYGVYIGSTLVSPSAYVNLYGNNSNTGYIFVNPIDGTFRLSPLDVATVNTGTIDTSGTIDIVAGSP